MVTHTHSTLVSVLRKTQALSYQNTEKQVQQSMLPYGLNQTHTHMAQVMTLVYGKIM